MPRYDEDYEFNEPDEDFWEDDGPWEDETDYRSIDDDDEDADDEYFFGTLEDTDVEG